jgi:hypothetical protein
LFLPSALSCPQSMKHIWAASAEDTEI